MKTIVEDIMKNRKDNQPVPNNNMLDKMDDKLDIKDNVE